jgi:MazG family protein
MKRQTLQDLKKIMVSLRAGCPWDQKQTPQSLTPYAVEEALELEDAILHKTPADVKEELGDLLFQVVFQSQMAEEEGHFTLDDVIHSLCEKMIERHPHVFAKTTGKKITTAEGVKTTWEKTKSEKINSTEIFKMPNNFPSLLSAVKIGKKTRTIDFDWYKVSDVFQQFLSEVDELKATLRGKDKAHQMEELGDTLFTLAQVARLLDLDPEKSLRLANKKVVTRIKTAFAISGLSWKEYCALSVEKKEILWKKAKTQLKKATSKRRRKT